MIQQLFKFSAHRTGFFKTYVKSYDVTAADTFGTPKWHPIQQVSKLSTRRSGFFKTSLKSRESTVVETAGTLKLFFQDVSDIKCFNSCRNFRHDEVIIFFELEFGVVSSFVSHRWNSNMNANSANHIFFITSVSNTPCIFRKHK